MEKSEKYSCCSQPKLTEDSHRRQISSCYSSKSDMRGRLSELPRGRKGKMLLKTVGYGINEDLASSETQLIPFHLSLTRKMKKKYLYN